MAGEGTTPVANEVAVGEGTDTAASGVFAVTEVGMAVPGVLLPPAVVRFSGACVQATSAPSKRIMLSILIAMTNVLR